MLGLETVEVGQILDEASLALETPLLSPSHVRAAYTGLRVLPVGDGGTATARRETVITRSPGGMLNVAGGKLTTYRRIALEALTRLRSELGIHRIDSRPWPLPGAAPSSRPDLEGVDPHVRAHLEHLYGSLAGEVLAPARDDPALLERLHPAGPDIAAQARYAVDARVGTDGGGRPPPAHDALLSRPRGRCDRRTCRDVALGLGGDAVEPALEERAPFRAHRIGVLLDLGEERRRAVGSERALERRDVLRNLGPFARHLGRDLQMELDAVCALEAERLVRVRR